LTMQAPVSPASRQLVRSRAVLATCLLLAAAVAGCGAGMAPELKAALVRVQDLGGKVNFEKGGYTVNLANSQVEDGDLGFLTDIPKLKRLNLQGTQITDAALDSLLNLKTLEIIMLQRTRVTSAGVDKLKAALPEADIRLQ